MRCPIQFYLSVPILYMAASTAVAAEPNAIAGRMPVAASIETTLSTASRQIRQFAFDGHVAMYFCSGQNPDSSDHFTLIFDKPVEVKSIAVVTGRPDGGDALDAGNLYTSIDGKTSRSALELRRGNGACNPGARPIRAIRIKPAQQLTHPLVIRELTIDRAAGGGL